MRFRDHLKKAYHLSSPTMSSRFSNTNVIYATTNEKEREGEGKRERER